MAKAFDEFYKSTAPIAHSEVPFIVVTESADDCPDIRDPGFRPGSVHSMVVQVKTDDLGGGLFL